MPLDRQPVLVGAAPQVAALGGEVQESVFVHHDGGAHIARVAGHIGQIQHAAGCVKIRDAPPVQQAIVAAEVDVGAVAHRAGPVEAVAVGGEGLHRVVGELDLIVGSRVAAAGPGAEVQVGPVGGDGGVDLAIDAGQDIRHSGFVLIQAGKSHNLAAGTGKPLTALVVVILADGTHIEGIVRRVVGGTLVVQIGGRQLEAALGVQRGSLRAVGIGSPDDAAAAVFRAPDLGYQRAAGSIAIVENVSIGSPVHRLQYGHVVHAVPAGAGTMQLDVAVQAGFIRRGRSLRHHRVVIVAAAVDVPGRERAGGQHARGHRQRQAHGQNLFAVFHLLHGFFSFKIKLPLLDRRMSRIPRAACTRTQQP